jgi:Bacterial archaeo-eukaryotic release factor family 10
MLTWDDIRAIDAIADPLGVLSVYADRPEDGGGRLVRAVSVAGELRRLDADLAAAGDADRVAAARRCAHRIRPALARMLGGRAPGRALFAPLSTEEVFEVEVGMPVGLAAVLDPTAYVRPLVAALDEGRPAGVIIAEGRSTRLLSWRMGAVEPVGEFGRPERLGAPLARSLAAEARAVAGERRWTRVVVAGDSRLAHVLARAAAPPGCEVSVVTRPVAGLGPRGLAAAVGGALHEAQRRYEWRLVERTIETALGAAGGAVLGPGRTRRALDQGVVKHLLFDAEREYREPKPRRPVDGWADRDPAEDLIERALHGGADITPVEGPARRPLGAAEGIAALLR